MAEFNNLFKKIILENNLSMPGSFPTMFTDAETGLEFIFDIMPTFGPQYQWHTEEDLEAIPELVLALKNSPKNVLAEIGGEFYAAGLSEENEAQNPDEANNLFDIGCWIKSLAGLR